MIAVPRPGDALRFTRGATRSGAGVPSRDRAGHLIGRHLGQIRFVPCAARSMPAPHRRKALEDHDWIAPDKAMPEHPSVRWRRKHFPRMA